MAVRDRLSSLALAVAVTACGGKSKADPTAPPSQVEIDKSAPAKLLAGGAMYVPGEYLAFKVKYKALAGGETQIITGQPGVEAGRKAIVIKSITATKGLVAVFKQLRDELTTVIDTDSGAPITSQNAIESGRTLRRIDVAFGDRAYALEHSASDTPRESWKQIIPEDGPWAHDLHSILAHLRAWSPETGARGYCYVQSARTFFRFDVTAVGREVVDTEAGEFEALRFDGVGLVLDHDGKPHKSGLTRKLSFWISTGPARIPVKLLAETQYGDVYAILVEHRAGGPAITLR